MSRDEMQARVLAHELEAALVSLELRLHALAKLDSCRGEAQACLDEVGALQSLVRDVLLLDRPRTAKQRFSLAVVLWHLERRFGPIARARRIRIELPAAGPEAVGDPRATERILSNLLDNAIKFSADGAAVRVRALVENDSAMVEVQDEGPGIPEKDREKIFLPFERLDREKEGWGLGLSIARTLAEAQGGTVTVSDASSGGARFLLTLPSA